MNDTQSIGALVMLCGVLITAVGLGVRLSVSRGDVTVDASAIENHAAPWKVTAVGGVFVMLVGLVLVLAGGTFAATRAGGSASPTTAVNATLGSSPSAVSTAPATGPATQTTAQSSTQVSTSTQTTGGGPIGNGGNGGNGGGSGGNGLPPVGAQSSTTAGRQPSHGATSQKPPTTPPAGTVFYTGSLAYDGSDERSFDLDFSPPEVFGPTNTLKFVAAEIDVVVPNGAKAAPSWNASSLPGRQQCVNALAQAPGDYQGLYQNPSVGMTFCFQTAGGRYGAARVTDDSAHYVVSVIVWS